MERLQRRLRDLAEWRQAAQSRRRDALGEAHGEMLAALSEGLLALGGAAAAGSRRIRALEVEIAVARDVGEAQARETLAHGIRSRLVARAVEAAMSRHRSDVEKKSLADVIDGSLRAAGPGSRKP
jgi:hypothetical protein